MLPDQRFLKKYGLLYLIQSSHHTAHHTVLFFRRRLERCLCVCRQCAYVSCSSVDGEGQQLVRVQIVERAEVRQSQEEFGEESGVVGAMASDE